MKEIFPSLFLIMPDAPGSRMPFTYLLSRPEGNVLLATKADIGRMAPDILAAGALAHVLLGDRHHAEPHTEALAKRLGPGLSCSDIEAAALKKQGVVVASLLPYRHARLGGDTQIIPTPGHTRGAFSYLWTHRGRRFLFVGDTIVPVDGAWRYWVTAPNRAAMRRTVRALSELDFDVILSNSFAATPAAWREVDPDYRAAMFAALDRDLAA